MKLFFADRGGRKLFMMECIVFIFMCQVKVGVLIGTKCIAN